MFKKGQSGNPGGRPRGVVEVRELAQALTVRAFGELERIAFESPDDRARLAAIQTILDRAYGKPVQPVDGGPAMVTVTWLSSPDGSGESRT